MNKVSIVIIDSRSDKHKDWVVTAIKTAKEQVMPCDVIVVDNVGKNKTIGQCWNEGVDRAKGDYVLFLGDDDWLCRTYVGTLVQYALLNPNYVAYTTYMTAYDDTTKLYAPIQRICTGMWRRDYLLKHRFNEKLQKGIDREYIEESTKRGDSHLVVSHSFGYYYRKHDDYSCAGDIKFTREPKEIYIMTPYPTFIKPLEEKLGDRVGIFTGEFDYTLADGASTIISDFLTPQSLKLADYECSAKKILRVHAYEAFGELPKYVDFSRFHKVIFVAAHIKDYIESKYGKIPNAAIIPNGVDMKKFTLPKQKKVNNKIAYAGYLTRKKGIGELLLIADWFDDYEFHLAGKFQEDDVAHYVMNQAPKNVHIHPWQYDLNEWFKDKTYIINTSLREGCPVAMLQGMAAGLKPLVRQWEGSVDIFDTDPVYSGMEEIKFMLEGDVIPDAYRTFVDRNYNFESTCKQIEAIIKE